MATASQSEKDKALEAALQQIQKQFGKGAIMKLGDNTGLNIDTISTGSISLDLATGVGGVPRGRITEIYGPESSGKTTLALHIIAEAQKNGGRAAFIDAEHALDPEYSANLGVDINELLVSQPDTGEQALEICEHLVRSGAIDVIVIDSVAALVPKAEIQGDMGDSHVGLHARLMSQALRKLAGFINKSNTCAIFINQLREKVGVMFGNPEVTTGGRALKFYSTMRIDVRRIEGIKSGDQFIGNRTRAKIVKNKVAPPFKQAEFDIMYGEGISRVGDTLDCAVENKIVDKAGAWYSFESTRIGQGRENAKRYLSENTELLNRIESLVLETLNPSPEAEESVSGNDEESKSEKTDSKGSKTSKSENTEDLLETEGSDDLLTGIEDITGLESADGDLPDEIPEIDLETGEILE
ncbi:MAG: recombinase RecA [Firmicutes bacterium]|nr:recombinase RecA [Bacillota bacterium]